VKGGARGYYLNQIGKEVLVKTTLSLSIEDLVLKLNQTVGGKRLWGSDNYLDLERRAQVQLKLPKNAQLTSLQLLLLVGDCSLNEFEGGSGPSRMTAATTHGNGGGPGAQ